jgi:hypothetical protein
VGADLSERETEDMILEGALLEALQLSEGPAAGPVSAATNTTAAVIEADASPSLAPMVSQSEEPVSAEATPLSPEPPAASAAVADLPTGISPLSEDASRVLAAMMVEGWEDVSSNISEGAPDNESH